jgi:uncharacterized protein YifE (UPF0438 family)
MGDPLFRSFGVQSQQPIEAGIAAASRATLAAADEVYPIIGRALTTTMCSAWTAVTDEANDREGQQAALIAAAREYNAEFQKLWSKFVRRPGRRRCTTLAGTQTR